MNDSWFQQEDSTNEFLNPIDEDGFLNVYRYEICHLYRVFWILHPFSRSRAKRALERYAFDGDYKLASGQFTVSAKDHFRKFGQRVLRSTWLNTIDPPRNRYPRKFIRCDQDQGQTACSCQISLHVDFLRHDLRQHNNQVGLLCAEIQRFSEKTLSELGVSESHTITATATENYAVTYTDCDRLLFRMKSSSSLMGKKIVTL